MDVGAGRLQQVTLLRCSSCLEYVTMDGRKTPSEDIVSRESISKSKMRTITTLLNSGVYQDLEDLLAKETGGVDSAKIMNEIVALGLKEYRNTFS